MMSSKERLHLSWKGVTHRTLFHKKKFWRKISPSTLIHRLRCWQNITSKQGHLSFEKMRLKAARGDLPKSFLKCRVPICASCTYGKQTRTPWRTKAPPNDNVILSPKEPGDVVGMDMLVSSTPGFIGQMCRILTRCRYNVTTVFVDHFSGLSFVHFQLSSSAEQTI